MKKLAYLTCCILLIACGSKNTSVKKYYFPYAKLTTPQVYVFTDSAYASRHMYWRLRTEVQQADTVLGIHIFNSEMQLTSILFNQITADGVSLKKMTQVFPETGYNLQYSITHDEVFAWNLTAGRKLYVAFGVQDSSGAESMNVTMEKWRSDKNAVVQAGGKKYACLVMKEITMLNTLSANRTKSEEQQRTDYYAEGVGLIKMETYLSDGSASVMTLDKIIPENEWEQMRRSSADTLQVKATH